MASRAKRQSDAMYNARRRFRREAERYMKKAAGAKGATKSRYEAQAQQALKRAAATYEKFNSGKTQIAAVAKQLNIELSQLDTKKISAAKRAKAIAKSYESLEGVKTLTSDRNTSAKAILSSGNVGARFYGGFSEIWATSEEGKAKPNAAIADFFGVEDVLAVLEMLEAAGIDIYRASENSDVYKSVQLALQKFVLEYKHARA